MSEEPFPELGDKINYLGETMPDVGEALPKRIMIFLKLEQGVETPCSDNLRPSHYPFVLFFSSLHSIPFLAITTCTKLLRSEIFFAFAKKIRLKDASGTSN